SEGTLWIHDYKTSSRKISEEDARNEDQLALYQIGLTQNPHFGPKEKMKLLWHFVAFEKDQVVSERTPKEIERLKERYISKIETIEKSKSYPTKTGVLCQWCEFLTVCTDGQKWVENKKKNAEAQASTAKPANDKTSPTLVISAEPIAPAAVVENPKPVFNASVPPASSQADPKPGRKKRSLAAVSPDQLPLF
ncbi:MAG TPA: PD-(D/E)XK nuclease family protein, partial [bacterium]|nr:PD-(D/E)XK nuclease family protein [bacterium]